MEAKKKKEKKRTSWLYEDGKKMPLNYTPSGKLSKVGQFLKDHPGGYAIEILDMRAVMK
ncbi:hypothetical protein FACS189440_07500 [Bacteroidia bacterium]|nr:hypothetical protein FACS189440_07500 [Bacteroidia bacterium]